MIEKLGKKKTIIVIVSFVLIMIIGGITYSWYMHYEETSTRKLIAGDLWLELNDGVESISLTNVYPITAQEARARNDNSFTFSVRGINPTSNVIYYEILLNHGDEYGQSENPPYERFTDQDLAFDLISIDSEGNELQTLVSAESYFSLDGRRIYVDSVPANQTTEIVKRYKVRMWLKEDVLISDTDPERSYCATDNCVEGELAYKYHYGSVKIGVYADNNIKGTDTLYSIMNTSAVMDNTSSTYVSASTGIDFSAVSSNNNGKGIYKRAGTESTAHPILYYRGEVNNNNVYFAGYCWKIVRTTETGGIKLVYAGENTGTKTNPVCNNTDTAAAIMSATFNSSRNSPAYVGYMYGDVYEWTNAKETEGAYFGTGFDYDNGKYKLRGAKVGIDNDHHYTCNDTDAEAECTDIRYYYYYNSDYGDDHDQYYMYITLSGGKNIDNALDDMRKNEHSSNAKAQIDSWYSLHMTNYTNKLEDTIWCNDRSIYQLGGWNPSGGGITSYMSYEGLRRRDSTRVPNLGCLTKRDAFTVSNSNGNKMLRYPVALLTSDEIMLAGGQSAANDSYYLYTNNAQWSLSPCNFVIYSAYEFGVSSSGYLNGYGVGYSYGLRPAVSLQPGTMIDKGDGTVGNPYVVS